MCGAAGRAAGRVRRFWRGSRCSRAGGRHDFRGYWHGSIRVSAATVPFRLTELGEECSGAAPLLCALLLLLPPCRCPAPRCLNVPGAVLPHMLSPLPPRWHRVDLGQGAGTSTEEEQVAQGTPNLRAALKIVFSGGGSVQFNPLFRCVLPFEQGAGQAGRRAGRHVGSRQHLRATGGSSSSGSVSSGGVGAFVGCTSAPDAGDGALWLQATALCAGAPPLPPGLPSIGRV